MARYGTAADFLTDEEGNILSGRDVDGQVISERAGTAYQDEALTTQLADLQEPDGTVTGTQVVPQTDGAIDFVAPTFEGVVWLVMPGWSQPRPMLPHNIVDRLAALEAALGAGGSAVIRGTVGPDEPVDPQVGDVWIRTAT